MKLNDAALTRLEGMMALPDRRGNCAVLLENVLRLMAKWRSQLIANTIMARDGVVVQSGPFKGMQYVAAQTEGGLAPRLLGTYESELHPAIARFVEAGLDHIVDIGCAEGYYAVGFAMAAPLAKIHAFDISEVARRACHELAKRNGVTDRVSIGGEFKGEDFAIYADEKSLIFIDAEGAEDVLIDPELYPALRRLNIIVETHPGARPGVTERLRARFAQSHHVEMLVERAKALPEGSWLNTAPTLDQYLATWEWRAIPTPWLVMTPKPDAAPVAA